MTSTTGNHESISEIEYISGDEFYGKKDVFGVWRSKLEIPDYIYSDIFELNKQDDYYIPIKNGKEWLFELTCKHQPRTGAVLMEGGELLVRASYCGDRNRDRRHYLLKLGLSVHGKFVRIARHHWGSNPSDWDGRVCERPLITSAWYDSLPRSLAEAYWHRYDGMDLPFDATPSIDVWMMPRPMGRGWDILDYWLTDRYRGYAGKYLPWFDERFPQLKPEGKGEPYYGFRCILEAFPRDETRKPSEILRTGVDSLWVEIGAKDRLVYLITNGEVDKMRVLTDPVEAVDRYCEHVLLNRVERFDFYQFSRPIA